MVLCGVWCVVSCVLCVLLITDVSLHVLPHFSSHACADVRYRSVEIPADVKSLHATNEETLRLHFAHFSGITPVVVY